MKGSRLVGSAFAVAVLALAAAGIAGADSGRMPLTGEEFLVQDVTMTIDCDPTRTSSVAFFAAGVATGPYPGTFTASGTVTIAPQAQAGPRPGTVAGPLTSLSEAFTITSSLGTINGTKKLIHNLPFSSSHGSCQQVTGFSTGDVTNASGTVVDIFSQPRYGAKFQSGGNFHHDRGTTLFSTSELSLDGTCPTGPCHYRLASFDEFFTSSAPQNGDDGDTDDMDDQLEAAIGY
jgi:hypothetical protein